MKISDCVLRAHLGNVLWVGGGACGGKSTVTRLLAEKHGFIPYLSETLFQEHKALACPDDHPVMLQPFLGWWFNRPVDEYAAAIEDADRERFEMVVADLLRLSGEGTVVVDAFFADPAVLQHITEPEKVIFLFATDDTVRDVFFARDDKQDVLGVINTLADPEKARRNVLDGVCDHTAQKLEQVRAAGWKYLVRDSQVSLDDTLAAVEEHFGLA